MDQTPEPTLPADLELLFPHMADVHGVDALPFYVGMPLDEMIASYEVTQDWLRAHPLPIPVPFWTRHVGLRNGLLIAGASVASVGLFAAVVVLVPWGSLATMLTPAPAPIITVHPPGPITDDPLLRNADAMMNALTNVWLPVMGMLTMIALGMRFLIGR